MAAFIPAAVSMPLRVPAVLEHLRVQQPVAQPCVVRSLIHGMRTIGELWTKNGRAAGE